ncbi:aminoglycoside phosphotransferase family protein (plasmid) [Streptomycetaceae bacterium NBC_01309]
MDTTDAAALLTVLLSETGRPEPDARTPVRVWARSGVERLTWLGTTGAASVVFKYAEAPFDREDTALRLAGSGGAPVPALHAAAHLDRPGGGILGMLMEDLGEPLREATIDDAARVAAAVHRVAGTGLAAVAGNELAAMAARSADRVKRLGLDQEVTDTAAALAAAAPARAAGATLAPYGLVHSEFHPTSLHVGVHGVRVLDFARAFTGPGLIDLASWQGTMMDLPDQAATGELIDRYIAAGGDPDAATDRAGLPAAAWALGWHRVWVVDWYTERMDAGWAVGKEATWTDAITRHVRAAAVFLQP